MSHRVGPYYPLNCSMIVDVKSTLQIPELFYMPEALTNENQIDLGWTQKGEKLGKQYS